MDVLALEALVNKSFEDEIIGEISRYTRIECLSPASIPNGKHTVPSRRAALQLSQWCQTRAIPNAHVEVIKLGKRTPVIFGEIAATDPGRAGSTTLIYGHLDKQPPSGNGEPAWGRIHRSARTNVSTVEVRRMMATRRLLRSVPSSHSLVLVRFTAGSSCSSRRAKKAEARISIATWPILAERIGDVGLIVCLDSGCATYDRLWVTTSLRGIIVGTLRVEVLHEGVHSGHAGGIVPSSFRICRELLARIEDARTGEILIPELRAEIPPQRRTEIEHLAAGVR